MSSWDSGLAYQAVLRAFVDGDRLDQAGGPLDVRAVVAGIRTEVKDGLLLEEVPWDRFPEGVSVRENMERLRSGDAVRGSLGMLIVLCANDMRAAVAPTVPFLIRIGTDPEADHRAEALAVTAEVARMQHQGVCTRAAGSMHAGRVEPRTDAGRLCQVVLERSGLLLVVRPACGSVLG
ncbi:hypothetical protein [Streptomyces sp. NPDC058086]|uniref:hypothetical protein n=1 Tax=Streptomyces sp. NPDC058086 TaxID=3346334 RepID=UPI0036E398E9